MKRVLLITYHFPPRPTVGSIRMEGLAKYLPRFGWECIVVTPRYPGRMQNSYHIVETEYADVIGDMKRRLGLRADRGLQEQLGISGTTRGRWRSLTNLAVNIVKTVICFPDEHRGWFQFGLDAARSVVRSNSIDAIITSSKPETAHSIGSQIKREFGIPWVADFRDLWTQNHYYGYLAIRRVLERRVELRTLSKADALVTVSSPLARKLEKLHRKPVYCITNGFDPDIVCSNHSLTECFTITYTGSLYDGKRDPATLFKALRNLADQGAVDLSRIRIRFIGDPKRWVIQEASEYGLADLLEMHPHVNRYEALRFQRESQVLLLLNWNDPDETGVYTGKLFEYLAARRPILALGGPPGVVASLLEETGAGMYAGNAAAAAGILLQWWIAYTRTGQVPYFGVESAISKYSQVEMSRCFAAVLDQVTESRPVGQSVSQETNEVRSSSH